MTPDLDLLVRGGSVVTPDGIVQSDVMVAEGRIERVGASGNERAKETIDASGLFVMAGFIDSHVHFNEPGRAEWEGIATGSSALAAGGGTLFFDMPLNSLPPVTSAAAAALKLGAARRLSRTDFGVWGGLVPGNTGEFEGMRDAGVVGLKAFMCASGVEEYPQSDAATLREGMARAAQLGMIVAVHAEDEALARRLALEARTKGTGAASWLRSRPVELETTAIRTAADIAGETGCSLHIVHASCPESVNAAREAKARGVDITVETCPHYLLLSEGDALRLGAPAKCAPPLRPEALRQGLWSALEAGHVDTVGSDHSPAPPAMKTSADFFEVWGGISGCQHGFGLLLSEAVARHGAQSALMRLTGLLSANVARRFGIDGAKGRIAAGLDADLVLLAADRPHALSNADLLYRHRQGPYDGRASTVDVVRTVVRGRTVWDKGRIAPGAPHGHLVRPARRR
ncbi:MAG TPA: allantoinase AllB [Opitutaceae bacterium]|jgi:allantoinase